MAGAKKLLGSPILWLCLFALILLVTRVSRLTAMPMFTDEAIYIRWSQIGSRDAAWRFISLTDGKQPLFTWGVMAALRFFTDPLVAGRMVSVGAGLLAMTGLFFAAREFFKSTRIGLVAAFLYVISPFALVHDRLAIYDSLVTAFSVWNLYIAVLLARHVRLDIALILGMTLGMGMLNKTSAFLSLYMLPATLVLFDWKGKHLMRRLVTWAGLAVLAAVLSQVFYSVLRLSPFFYIVTQKDALFVYPFREWIGHPFRFFIGNIHGMWDWFVGYLGWPVVLSAAAAFVLVRGRVWEKLLLVGWWLAPFTALALFGRVLYPRFIFFMTMPVMILAASTISSIFDDRRLTKGVAVALATLILFPNVYLSYRVLADIRTAPIPHSDSQQYVNSWAAGWGVREIVAYLANEAAKGKVTVYTEGTFGLMPYALEIYLADNRNMEIIGVWPLPKDVPQDVIAKTADHPVYLLMYQGQYRPEGWRVGDPILSFGQGMNDQSRLRLYRVGELK